MNNFASPILRKKLIYESYKGKYLLLEKTHHDVVVFDHELSGRCNSLALFRLCFLFSAGQDEMALVKIFPGVVNFLYYSCICVKQQNFNFFFTDYLLFQWVLLHDLLCSCVDYIMENHIRAIQNKPFRSLRWSLAHRNKHANFLILKLR